MVVGTNGERSLRGRSVACSVVLLAWAFPLILAAAQPPEPNAAWRARNEAIRAKIAKLDRAVPAVARDLPLIQRRIEGLFTRQAAEWNDGDKLHQAIAQVIDAPLDSLLAGQDAFAWCRGKRVTIPYLSETTGGILKASVDVPPGYEPGREYQLFLSYKGRPRAESVVQTDTFFACGQCMYQAKGRYGVRAEAGELVALLTREFPGISADRVFLTGFSDGGYTAFWAASRYPHLFAGIAPMVANWQWGNVENWGLMNVPTLILEGTMDAIYVHENTNRWHMLVTHGCDTEMMIGPYGHDYVHWEKPEYLKEVTAWAATKRRDPWPRRVRYATWNLYWHQAYWVSIQRMIDPRFAADFDVRVEGNTIDVHANNVATLRLTLSDKLLDPARPVNVVTETGKSLYSGPFREQLDLEIQPLPASPFAKTPENHGDLDVVNDRSMYLVDNYRPVGPFGVPAEKFITIIGSTVTDAEAKLLDQGHFFGQSDTKLDEATLASHHLRLVGTPAQNAVLRRIADQLPVRFEPGRFIVGDRVFDRPNAGVHFVHPSPFNPRKHITVTAYNDIATAAAHGFPRTPGAVEFREGDLVLFDIPATKEAPVERERLLFDTHWRVPATEVLRTLSQPMSYKDYLQLTAKALKQQAGAEAAMVLGAPDWLRWRKELRDTITVDKVATMHSVPDYVVVCELKGELLKSWAESGLIETTVVPGRDHPAFEPGITLTYDEIVPTRWYRVAVNYWITDEKIIAFTDYFNRENFPPMLRMRAPADYERNTRINLLSRNMMLTDLQTPRLVIEYLRGSVLPAGADGATPTHETPVKAEAAPPAVSAPCLYRFAAGKRRPPLAVTPEQPAVFPLYVADLEQVRIALRVKASKRTECRVSLRLVDGTTWSHTVAVGPEGALTSFDIPTLKQAATDMTVSCLVPLAVHDVVVSRGGNPR